ncbi:MAG: EAL domain-containing protein [Alphaproteobacteria bacterium]|nr:MAG: EAL domain-containing protein [Alphaproteobacteria bacterium]
MGWGPKMLAALTDVGEAETAGGRALLAERYRALQRQIPLLYTICLANLLGLHLAVTKGFASLVHPSTLLIPLILIRLYHWTRTRNADMPPERIVRELTLLRGGGETEQYYVILFGSLASIGCAYGLSSFPGAARLPLLFLALPLATMLILSPISGHVGLGISIALIIVLILRLLSVHNESFVKLVESRVQVEAERERARRAEKAAKAEKAKARRIADTDPLTGLANRRAFLRSLGRQAGLIERDGGAATLAIVDLDGFKPINDTFGHAMGDAVLEEVGRRLTAAGGPASMIARMGGDEFALILESCGDEAEAQRAGRAICRVLEDAVFIDSREFHISGCCGLTILRAGDCNVTEALIRADTALYRAKEQGRAGTAVFSQEMGRLQRRRTRIEQALRRPEERDLISLVYQPIFDISNNSLRAFEALARWEHPELGTLSPAEFIPIAEQVSAIETISDRLLEAAAAEALLWPDSVRLSFNVSAVQLCTAGCAARILAILGNRGIHPRRLQVEVTETALLVDFATARTNLQALRAAGTRIVLDDFGAGHASISYLREMQFDGIKLDGALVASVQSTGSRRLLKGVVDLCASLGVPCVAEHIEQESELDLLRGLGCRYGQGFLLSPPLAAADAAALAGGTVTRLRRAAA